MIRPFKSAAPMVPASAFVESSAQVIGDVALGDEASIWYNAVLRGDVGPIRIGARSNIQDGAILHSTRGKSVTTVGADVTVGHAAILHGCAIGDRVLVGMGAIIMDNASVGEDSIVAAGALVPPGTKLPPRSLVMGSPARVARALRDDEVAEIARSAARYVDYARDHRP